MTEIHDKQFRSSSCGPHSGISHFWDTLTAWDRGSIRQIFPNFFCVHALVHSLP